MLLAWPLANVPGIVPFVSLDRRSLEWARTSAVPESLPA
jgi:hypothetical protein